MRLTWRGSHAQFAKWPVTLGARRVPVSITAVQLDPRKIRLSLEIHREGTKVLPWTIGHAPQDVIVALNAGQFTDDGPWGWVVHRGREYQPPGSGSLAGALVIDSTGSAHIVDANSIPALRNTSHVVEAVQSYPLLLKGSAQVPGALCMRDSVDATHRDRRLAVGIRADSTVVIALSHYDGAGSAGERLPIGPTTQEMVAIMRRLGAVQAIMLDGGLSAQLLLRDEHATHRWPGLRGVPLALIGRTSTH